MRIIAIETSHDDTSVVLYENKQIIKEISFTQTEFHKKFGGTVPEFASRGHFENLPKALKILKEENMLEGIDHVAYTNEPGLIGSLHMGALFGEALAFALNVPVRKINHMHGHVFAVAFTEEVVYPALALIVSGGHTQLWNVQSPFDITLIGQTKDDAVGEIYDKISRAMKLGFPGGPVIDKLAQQGNNNIDFSLRDDQTYNFSFSGMKTKVINYIHNINQKKLEMPAADIAASFQENVVDILIRKTRRAIEEFKPASIILGGGVAANSELRKQFATLHEKALIPAMRYTTDNAMMIAITSDIKESFKK